MLSVGLISLQAQQVNQSNPAEQSGPTPAKPVVLESAKPDEEVLVLSPFVVDASQDKGYRATSTLAGSRINTQMKDVAAPVTVLTKEFLDDLGAVGINDVMSYLANGEGTGSYTQTNAVLGAPSDEIVQNPTTAQRVRGLQSADITRDYYYSLSNGVGFDSYNLDQVTLSRGPNSILAGLGSPAGIINYSPQQAGLGRNSTEVSYRFGSWGDQRATLNSNLVLADDKLAVRVAGAWSEKGYKQQPAFNKDQRLYFAATFKPWQKTSVRASYEQVAIDRNLPNTLTPEDGVTQWVSEGKPTASPPATPAYSFPAFDGAGQTLIYNTAGVLVGAQPMNAPNSRTYAQKNLTGVKIWTPLRLNHNRYLDLENLNTNAQFADITYKTYTFSIDQEILPNLNANVGYTREDIEQERIVLYRPQYTILNIDVNTTTPWGAPNPFFGQLYMDQRGLDNKNTSDNKNEVMRGTLTYDLDLNKHSKWLGRWRLTGFAESRETNFNSFGYTTNATFSSGAAMTQLNARHYLGGSFDKPATTVPIYHGLVSSVPHAYFDSATSSWKSDTLTSSYVQGANNKRLDKLDTSAVVLQTWLWDDRIVGLFGYRKDKNGSATLTSQGTPVSASAAFPALTELSGTTRSLGVVYHATKWLSFHYNKSDNFVPNAGSIDLLGNPTPSPTGEGTDYGASFNLFDDKLNLKLNIYELESKDGPAGSDASFAGWWSMPWFDTDVMKALATQAGKPYQQGIQAGLIYGDPRLTNGYTANSISKGLELEATYNVTKNWRIMGSISKQDAKQSGVAVPLTEFINKRIEYYKAQGLWTGVVGAGIWGAAQTGEQHYNQWVLPGVIAYQASDGKPSQQIAEWHASGLTNYSFTEGKLKGWDIGGGLRYVDKAVIGNPAFTNASGAVTGLDTANPYTEDSYVGVDAWIGYSTKWREKYDVSFNLYVYDLQESGGFRAIGANSDGTRAVFRIIQPRSFYFTTKLKF
ncbi:catecholate siderophore receptor Fiu [Lacunisphaera limnophila]|uniref:Catecholate siderophore receptor Fiu n=2 Tax=Lacunisphaera limnophila TaxID=1838286 RepID=A0A1D8ATW4_9BACT|nr:catecholate siderophore receptor Fiu [Lacunisphaera limnophila]